MKTIYDRELQSLMASLIETEGDSSDRAKLFESFSSLLEDHSHAEERAFYSVVLADETTREKTAHGCKEHCKAAELLDELKKTDRSSPGWLQKMKKLREEVEHHITEEEEKLFPKAKKVLSETKAKEVGSAFLKEFEKEQAA